MTLTAVRIALAVFCLGLVRLAASDFSGIYRIVESREPGTALFYEGRVGLKKSGVGYIASWRLADGRVFIGCGLPAGRWLAAAFADGPGFGLSVYRRDGGKLSGRWIFLPQHGGSFATAGEEYLVGPANLEGTYAIVKAKDPSNGKPYGGTVTLIRRGDTWIVRWTLNDQSLYVGLGILVDDLLIVGWAPGNSPPGVIAYEPQADGELRGIWATPGFAGLGLERLRREKEDPQPTSENRGGSSP